MQYINKYKSIIGDITIASNGKEIIGLWFDGQRFFGNNLTNDYIEKDLDVFKKTRKWLDIYFSGHNPNFIPPINMDNISSFRKRVWQIMLNIPYGKTMTYGEIAKQIEKDTGKRVSSQAVGGAVGHNSISLIIPCHRVIGSNGNLVGYAGGIDKKIKLLKLEGIIS